MLKSEEINNPNSCWNKAKDDEIVFILLERDLAIVSTIIEWAIHRITLGKNSPGDEQIKEAYELIETIKKRRISKYGTIG